MKKIFYLLLILPLMMMSCKEDEMPNVKFNVEFSGGVKVNGTIYVVKGDTLSVENVEIASHGDKNAAMGEVSYFLDGLFLITKFFPPYKINIPTNDMRINNHVLEFNCPLYVEDSPILTAYFRYPVKLVSNPDSIPQDSDEPVTLNYKIVNN